MTTALVIAQLVNGVQFGVLLFLMSAGLTLVLGIMNCINLMHGSLYMMGAYLAAAAYGQTHSFLIAAAAGVLGTMMVGVVVERLVMSRLYSRSHLDQVLATFGLILFFNEVVRIVWGPAALSMEMPRLFAQPIDLVGLPYPPYRFAVLGVGVLVAGALYLLIHKTRTGIVIRAASANPAMTRSLGVNVKLLNMLVFGLGAALAGLAGVMASPIVAIQSGMGEPILILTLVIIVTGGIGSVRGAFYGALIVGVVDTVGRTFLPMLLRQLLEHSYAQAVSATITSMSIYVLMAIVLAVRPQGLFR
jgi:branched-chain amino acid transport system permease protein